jgi:hypothetical protein
MSQARGSNARFAIFQDEATYATAPGSPTGAKLYLTSFGVQASQPKEQSRVLTGTRGRPKPYNMNRAVQGAIGVEIGAENIGFLLRHTMGSVATTGSGPYVHTLTIGSLPLSFPLEVDYGSAISGNRYMRYLGCRINQATFTFPQAGACTASFDIMGAKEVADSSPLDASISDTGHTTFDAFSASIQEGGASIATVKSVEFSIRNNQDGDGYAIGGAGIRRAMPEGFAEVSGRLTALFESDALLNKAVDQTDSSLLITLSRGDGLGSAGNESISWEIANLTYERTTPPVNGPAGIVIDLSFTGWFDGTGSSLKVIIKNALSALTAS